MKTNQELIEEHDNSTMFCSFASHMKSCSTSYVKIVEQGITIVPDILKYLQDKNSGMNIIMLLIDILESSPYKPEEVLTQEGEKTGFVGYDVPAAKESWIAWGYKNGFLKK